MLQLYYTGGSPPSRAVLHTIRVLGLEVEVKNVDLMKGENKTDEFLKLNPKHQIPVLVDGDFVVAESRAIMMYLVNSRNPSGSPWYPKDAKLRAVIDSRLFFDAINFFELAASIVRPIFFFGGKDVPADKIAKLKETLKIFESFLEGNLYMTGSCPTILDISALSSYMMFKNTFTDYGELPNMTAWYERMKTLPGFEENEAASKGIMALLTAKKLSPVSMK